MQPSLLLKGKILTADSSKTDQMEGKRVLQEVEAIPVLISASEKPALIRWYSFFQFFKPVQDDVNLGYPGALWLGCQIFDHQESLAIGRDRVLSSV